MACLIIFSGLPGTGKSSIAKLLAQALRATWLRIDTIEQAVCDSGVVVGSLEDAGYRAAFALAKDNLRIGSTVVADSVNPWMLTRDAWRNTGLEAGATVIEIEVVCSDVDEHRRRVETRIAEVPGLALPDWKAVLQLDYHAWNRDRMQIDTARRSVADSVIEIKSSLPSA